MQFTTTQWAVQKFEAILYDLDVNKFYEYSKCVQYIVRVSKKFQCYVIPVDLSHPHRQNMGGETNNAYISKLWQITKLHYPGCTMGRGLVRSSDMQKSASSVYW